VEEGIRIFSKTRLRGISTFMVMADAAGEIAMVECTPDDCAVFRPEGDWFGHTNHARTEAMIPHDQNRSPDSFTRRAAMESAVRPHLGQLTPETGARILRDRANSRYANAATVGNLAVLNPTVVHPASGVLWHSTTMQPHAPFGEFLPFSPSGEAPDAPVLPADPGFAAGRFREEAEQVNEARRAAELADAGFFPEATGLLDRLARLPDGRLDPARLAWARARGRWSQGQLDVAYEILGELEDLDAPFDVRAHGLTMRAILADRLGRRDDALRLYEMARSHLAKRPEFNVFADLHERIALGLEAPQTEGALPETTDLMRIPH
jgi:tetratricopeptide (TPR) repeat protein